VGTTCVQPRRTFETELGFGPVFAIRRRRVFRMGFGFKVNFLNADLTLTDRLAFAGAWFFFFWICAIRSRSEGVKFATDPTMFPRRCLCGSHFPLLVLLALTLIIFSAKRSAQRVRPNNPPGVSQADKQTTSRSTHPLERSRTVPVNSATLPARVGRVGTIVGRNSRPL